jgi:hypothetical protein
MVPAGEDTQEAQQLSQNDDHDNNHGEEENNEEDEEEGNKAEGEDDEDYTPLSDAEKDETFRDTDEIKTTGIEAQRQAEGFVEPPQHHHSPRIQNREGSAPWTGRV